MIKQVTDYILENKLIIFYLMFILTIALGTYVVKRFTEKLKEHKKSGISSLICVLVMILLYYKFQTN